MTSSLGLIWNSERYSRPRAMNTSESGCCHSTLTRPPDSPSALAVSGRLMIGIFDMGRSPSLEDAVGPGACPARKRLHLIVERPGDREDVVHVIEFDAAGRGGPADEVEHPAILEAVI